MSKLSRLDAYFTDYAEYHRTPGNQRTHVFGIPMIVVAVLSWASRWIWFGTPFHELPASLLQLDLAVLIIAAATAWYVYLDWKMGVSFLPALLATYWIGRGISPEWAAALFILGWILQLVGHGIYEKKSPAFTRNIQHLLIGPIWVYAKFLHL